MTTFPESFVLESVLAERCMYHQEGPWVRLWAKWLARDNLETNPINHKTWGWVTWQNSSRFPYPAAFHLDTLPSTVVFFVSKCISSDNSFPNVRQLERLSNNLRALEEVPIPATKGSYCLNLNTNYTKKVSISQSVLPLSSDRSHFPSIIEMGNGGLLSCVSPLTVISKNRSYFFSTNMCFEIFVPPRPSNTYTLMI